MKNDLRAGTLERTYFLLEAIESGYETRPDPKSGSVVLTPRQPMSYPTQLVLHGDGKIIGIWTGGWDDARKLIGTAGWSRSLHLYHLEAEPSGGRDSFQGVLAVAYTPAEAQIYCPDRARFWSRELDCWTHKGEDGDLRPCEAHRAWALRPEEVKVTLFGSAGSDHPRGIVLATSIPG